MSKGIRQSQSTLHTWSGLLLGWILFLVFLTGTVAFWREGLNRYMRPELARIEEPMRVLGGAQRFLARKAPDAKNWFIAMPNAQVPGAQVTWQPQPKKGERGGRRSGGGRGRRDNQALIGADGTPTTARDTRGGEFFYRFHFDLYYLPVIWSRWLVGFASVMMLVAILTGIVTHKKIFRDFFTLRRNKGQRSWLDGHNATAVLALPFHLMITYTGIVTLMALLMPWATVANYADETKMFADLFPQAPVVERTGRPAPLMPLSTIARDAERQLGGPVGTIEVSQPGDMAARVTLYRTPASLLNTRAPAITYDGTTGVPVWHSPAPGGAAVTAGVMVGLHAGRFADLLLRWIYFLCGVAGTLMVASGLVLWTVKRREKLPNPAGPHFGFRVVERLNVAVLGGFPLGIAGLFWANRLLPVALPGRSRWEVHTLFIVWGGAAVLSMLRRPAAVWPILFGATGISLAALPIYNLFGTHWNWLKSTGGGDLLPLGVDFTMIVFAVMFLWLARRVVRYRPPARVIRRARAAAIPMSEMEAVA